MQTVGQCRLMKSLVAVLVACSVTALAVDAEPQSGGLLKVKAGSCKFTVLDSTGVKPLADASLSLVSAKDAKALAKTAPDRMGQCVVNVPEGRYILKVNERNITVVEASAASKVAECRILVGKDALVVGGQEEGDGAGGEGGGFAATQQVVFGGLVVITAGVGGNLIYENNNGDGFQQPTTTTTTTTTDDDDDDDESDPASP